MDPFNPFLCVIVESQDNGDEPRACLVKLMAMRCNCVIGIAAAKKATAWELANGRPTYPMLAAWARNFTADPEHADLVALLAERHRETSKGDDEGQKAWLADLVARANKL